MKGGPSYYLEIEARARPGAGPPRHHPGEGRARDRAPMPDREHRPRPPEAADRTHRLSDPRRGAADRRSLRRRARRVVPLGRHHAGHHRHCGDHADPRRARTGGKGHGGDRRGARRPFAALPRYADGRPQQPAAGRAADLRLQDRGTARRDATPPRAAGAAAPARSGRRIRRRGRNARLARRRRPQGAGGDDGGARSRPARHRLAHGARPHRRGRLLSRDFSPARWARFPWT